MDETNDSSTNQEAKPTSEQESKQEELEVKEETEDEDAKSEMTAEEKSPEVDNSGTTAALETSEALVDESSDDVVKVEPEQLKDEVLQELEASEEIVGNVKDEEEREKEATDNKKEDEQVDVQEQNEKPPVKEEQTPVPTVQLEPDPLPQIIPPESTPPPPPVVVSTTPEVTQADKEKDEPVASTATLAKPVESKRRGSIEKMSNFLRQFRSTGGFKKFTASQFMKVWNHYDSDGNGFIADNELDGFLREFVLSSVGENEVRPEILSESAMAIFKETFMDAFDENQDGMIDIAELAEILPTDENFLLLFHLKNPVESSVEFMKIWREYDKNCKGYIESTELKSFLKHILDNQKTSVSDEKLDEYTETILNLFDSNRDGKLQLCEMARLMPVKQNFLSKPILKGASCITRSDIDRLFKIYDQNRNGTIEDEELSGLLKDLMDLGKKDYTLNDIENMKKVIMDHWDTDHDGTISKSELRMFLIQQCKLSAESQGLQYDDEEDDYDDDDDFD